MNIAAWAVEFAGENHWSIEVLNVADFPADLVSHIDHAPLAIYGCPHQIRDRVCNLYHD
jgi:hypothetical protein